jgi:hypothetical protein
MKNDTVLLAFIKTEGERGQGRMLYFLHNAILIASTYTTTDHEIMSQRREAKLADLALIGKNMMRA